MCPFGDIRSSVNEKKTRNSKKICPILRHGIPRNSRLFRPEYKRYGSTKNIRNSVSTNFHGHPSQKLNMERAIKLDWLSLHRFAGKLSIV